MIHIILSIVVNFIEIKYIMYELFSHIISYYLWTLYIRFLNNHLVIIVFVFNFIDSIEHQRRTTLK